MSFYRSKILGLYMLPTAKRHNEGSIGFAPEPESTVVSRSGDECVVALTDQWTLPMET